MVSEGEKIEDLLSQIVDLYGRNGIFQTIVHKRMRLHIKLSFTLSLRVFWIACDQSKRSSMLAFSTD